MKYLLNKLFVLFSITVLFLATLSPVAGTVASDDLSVDNVSYTGSVSGPATVQNNLYTGNNDISNGSMVDLTNGSNVDPCNGSDSWPASNLTERLQDSDNDRLPDIYELTVTGTDPYNNDSDSICTNTNESWNGIADGREDFDHDMISTYGEYRIGTDPLNPDTDGDGLTDANEYYILGLSPLVSDSNNDGINDSDEDADGDGLTNLQEQTLGTNPKNNDSDWDTISDYDEVNIYFTNPLNIDTDNDQLDDNIELTLDSNPRVQDSDGNGIVDGQDSFSQQFADNCIGVSVQILGSGDLQQTMEIKKEPYPYAPLTRLSGIVSDFIDVKTSSRFNNLAVRIYYDEARLNGSSESNLVLYYFDETTNIPVGAPDQRIDTESNYIETTSDHLGVWFIADGTEWTPLSGELVEQKVQVLNKGAGMSLMAVDSMSYVAQASSSSALTFDLGDSVNIMARIHNTGDADVSQDVNVSFYEGDPSDDGVLIGSSMISGGILHNSSKIAVMHDYVIHSESADIYVQVDGENAINESSEVNNKAFKALSLGSQDSDGDGLSDTEELFGMNVQEPYGVVYSDPYLNDSDDDGLDDNVEIGEKYYDANGIPHYQMISYPKNPDSDDDGLSDFEEETGTQTIYLADSHQRALSFIDAISSGSDPRPMLNVITVTTNPLVGDCDHDGICDGDEVLNGTNPCVADSDGDSIADNLEAVYGEDPTIFDIDSPVVTDEVSVWKPSGTADAQYNIMMTVSDPGGVKDIKVFKSFLLGPQEKYSYTDSDRSTAIGISTSFTTPAWETLLDEFETTRVDIYASDWNGNSNTTLAYHRPSMFGQWANVLSTVTSDQGQIAGDMGLLAGSYAALAETPASAVELCQNPLMFLDGINAVVTTLYSMDPVLMNQLVDSVAASYHEREELENPYTDPALHDEFRNAWYSGYVATSIITMVAGGEVFKSVSTSAEFAVVTSRVTGGLNSVVWVLKASGKLKMPERVGYGLACHTPLSIPVEMLITSMELVPQLIKKVPCCVKMARVVHHYNGLDPEAKIALKGYEPELGEFFGASGDDGVRLINELDDNALINIFSLMHDDGVSGDKLLGVSSNTLRDFRIGIVKMRKAEASPAEISTYVNHIIELEDVSGSNKFVKSVGTMNTLNPFRDIEFEAERAVYLKRNSKGIELESLNKQADVKAIYDVNGQDIPTYIDQKTAHGVLTKNRLLQNFVDDVQRKFRDQEAGINGNPTKLEVNARGGLDLNENTLESDINDYMKLNYNVESNPLGNRISTIEIFKPGDTDTGSLILTRQSNGLFHLEG